MLNHYAYSAGGLSDRLPRQNVSPLYVRADTEAATHTGIYRLRGAICGYYTVFMAVLELKIWYSHIANTKQGRRRFT